MDKSERIAWEELVDARLADILTALNILSDEVQFLTRVTGAARFLDKQRKVVKSEQVPMERSEDAGDGVSDGEGRGHQADHPLHAEEGSYIADVIAREVEKAKAQALLSPEAQRARRPVRRSRKRGRRRGR